MVHTSILILKFISDITIDSERNGSVWKQLGYYLQQQHLNNTMAKVVCETKNSPTNSSFLRIEMLGQYHCKEKKWCRLCVKDDIQSSLWVSTNLDYSVCVQQVFNCISQGSPHQHEPYEEASSALRCNEFAAGCGLLHCQRDWTQPSWADRTFWSLRCTIFKKMCGCYNRCYF